MEELRVQVGPRCAGRRKRESQDAQDSCPDDGV